eukprot:8576828-Pyramimonas_sp.AAC.1
MQPPCRTMPLAGRLVLRRGGAQLVGHRLRRPHLPGRRHLLARPEEGAGHEDVAHQGHSTISSMAACLQLR